MKRLQIEKAVSIFFIIYFALGLIFAFAFALYYHWPPLSYFSPGFYMVIISWPYQAIGFAKDILYFGLAGKPV